MKIKDDFEAFIKGDLNEKVRRYGMEIMRRLKNRKGLDLIQIYFSENENFSKEFDVETLSTMHQNFKLWVLVNVELAIKTEEDQAFLEESIKCHIERDGRVLFISKDESTPITQLQAFIEKSH